MSPSHTRFAGRRSSRSPATTTAWETRAFQLSQKSIPCTSWILMQPSTMIVLIIGTNRPDSNTSKVAKQIEQMYADLKVPLQVLDLAKLPPEIFSPASYGEKPKSFLPFADAILASSGIHVVTPEYNGSLPGVLKY